MGPLGVVLSDTRTTRPFALFSTSHILFDSTLGSEGRDQGTSWGSLV
jgi:hypothetical protein